MARASLLLLMLCSLLPLPSLAQEEEKPKGEIITRDRRLPDASDRRAGQARGEPAGWGGAIPPCAHGVRGGVRGGTAGRARPVLDRGDLGHPPDHAPRLRRR